MRHKNKKNSKSRGSPPGRLRIVAGKWRNRVLPVAEVPGLRPTSERIRETLFNWLAPTIAGARCLDLFAGTGALGIEAMSRGAAAVEFVENSKVAAQALRHSIQVLEAPNATVHQVDAMAYLSGEPGERFDVVFLDPPFAAARYAELCRLLAGRGWLAKGGHIYLEQDSREPIPDLPAGWETRKEKVAGKVRYSLISTR